MGQVLHSLEPDYLGSIPVSLITCCVTLSKWLNFSISSVESFVKMGDKSTYFTGMF